MRGLPESPQVLLLASHAPVSAGEAKCNRVGCVHGQWAVCVLCLPLVDLPSSRSPRAAWTY